MAAQGGDDGVAGGLGPVHRQAHFVQTPHLHHHMHHTRGMRLVVQGQGVLAGVVSVHEHNLGRRGSQVQPVADRQAQQLCVELHGRVAGRGRQHGVPEAQVAGAGVPGDKAPDPRR